jgi:hypothetical protein
LEGVASMKTPTRKELRRRPPQGLDPEQIAVWRACISKHAFRSEVVARLSAVFHGQNLYLCRHCRLFHLTTRLTELHKGELLHD